MTKKHSLYKNYIEGEKNVWQATQNCNIFLINILLTKNNKSNKNINILCHKNRIKIIKVKIS